MVGSQEGHPREQTNPSRSPGKHDYRRPGEIMLFRVVAGAPYEGPKRLVRQGPGAPRPTPAHKPAQCGGTDVQKKIRAAPPLSSSATIIQKLRAGIQVLEMRKPRERQRGFAVQLMRAVKTRTVLIVVMAIMACTGLLFARNIAYNPATRLRLALGAAYGRALQALGRGTNQFHCVGASLAIAFSPDGE